MGAEDFLLNFLLRARDEASAVMRGFGANAGTVARDAQFAIGAIGLAAGAATFAAVKMAEDFDTPMRKVLALTGISADEFKHYKQQVLDLSAIVPKSAEDLANGLYFVVSAGFQGADAMKILEYSAKAASAGLTETKIVADAVTSALNAYKLGGTDAAHVTDLITEAVLQGKTEYGALAGSIGRVLPIAAALHVGLDEVLASMSTMTRIGLNADEAATALRGTLNSLAKPTKAAAEALDQMGLSGEILRQQLKEKGLLFVLQELMDKTHGNIETLGHIIPNIRALTGVLATAGSQGEQYAAILKSMSTAGGLTEDSFKKTAAGASASFGILKNNLAAIAITIGDVLLPPLVEFTGQLTTLVRGIREWMAQNPQMAEFIAHALALAAVFGTLAGGAATLGAAIGFVGGHLGGLFVGITAISHGLLAFLGPIALIIAAVLALKFAWDNDLGGIQERTKAVLDAIWSFIGPFVEQAIAELSKFWTEIQPKLAAAWGAISEAIRYFSENVIGPVVRALVDFWQRNWYQIELVLRNVWRVIVDLIRIAWDVISGLFKFWLDLISGNWQGAWDDMTQMVTDVFADMGRLIVDFFVDLLPKVIGLAFDLGGTIVRGIANGLGGLKTALWNAITGALNSVLDEARRSLASLGSPGQPTNAIPQFAGGGFMPYTGLAFVHAGEEILTPSQQRDRGRGGSREIRIPVYIDKRQVGEAVGEFFVDDARENGRSL